MQILFVTSVHPPFDPRIYHKFFCSIKKFGFEVKILLPDQVNLAKVNSDFYSFTGHHGKWARFFNNIKLIKRCITLKPKMIIFFDPDLLPFMLFYKIFYRANVIYDNHEDYPSAILETRYIPKIMRRGIRSTYLLIERLGVLVIDQMLCADPFTPRYYNYSLNPKITIIHNYPILNEVQNDEKEFDVIFPGSIDLCYNRIFSIIQELECYYQRNTRFLIIGRKVSEKIIREINEFSNNLKMTQLIFKMDEDYADTQNYIAKSKIGIIPLAPIQKFKNNIPTKMFEYLMHSIPQIASDLQPIVYYLNQTLSGFCIQEKNYEKNYAIKILEILDNYEVYAAYAQKDKKLLYQKWNWDLEEVKLIETINTQCEKMRM